MTTNERGQDLHDKATRGITLSPSERAELDTWYQRLDQEERELFSASEVAEGPGKMRAQVDAALVKLQRVVQRVRELEAENDTLKAEIHSLQQR